MDEAHSTSLVGERCCELAFKMLMTSLTWLLDMVGKKKKLCPGLLSFPFSNDVDQVNFEGAARVLSWRRAELLFSSSSSSFLPSPQNFLAIRAKRNFWSVSSPLKEPL